MIEVTHSTSLGHLHVRETLQNGGFHRHVVSPGDDISKEAEAVKNMANKEWTPKLIQKYKDSIKE